MEFLQGRQLAASSRSTSPTKSVTFPVSDVEPAESLLETCSYPQAVSRQLGVPIEACSQYHGQLVREAEGHPLIAALHLGFAEHRPVCLSPDIIWLTILQGFAAHIQQHAERFRHKFVAHSGNINLIVRRDDFIKGSPENPWEEVFQEFSEQIRRHIGERHAMFVSDFSTTGAVERAASEVLLMDTVQSYFEYEVRTKCGIPVITVEGEPTDWRNILSRVERLAEFNLDAWVGVLAPVLQQFVAASEGHIDRAFWESIYKHNGSHGSGTPYVTGWLVKLFPYLKILESAKVARFLQGWKSPERPSEASFQSYLQSHKNHLRENPWLLTPCDDHGPARDEFPVVCGTAPFNWVFDGWIWNRTYPMQFHAGLIGVRQDDQTGCLRPEIGWAVAERNA